MKINYLMVFLGAIAGLLGGTMIGSLAKGQEISLFALGINAAALGTIIFALYLLNKEKKRRQLVTDMKNGETGQRIIRKKKKKGKFDK